MTVDGLDYYVTTNYGEELYNSCKDVKFGTLNTRAMDFIGAGAKTYKGKMETLFCCWVSSLNGNYDSCTPSWCASKFMFPADVIKPFSARLDIRLCNFECIGYFVSF